MVPSSPTSGRTRYGPGSPGQRHGISRLPGVDGDKPLRTKFKRYPLGSFHLDIAEVHSEEGRLLLLVAIDRISEFAFAELREKATRRVCGRRGVPISAPNRPVAYVPDQAVQPAAFSTSEAHIA